jgi:predicted metalloenzyme YecM
LFVFHVDHTTKLTFCRDEIEFSNEILFLFSVINAPINEPPLPRRKKCPELAYRHNEFILDSNADHTDSSRARVRIQLFECLLMFQGI